MKNPDFEDKVGRTPCEPGAQSAPEVGGQPAESPDMPGSGVSVPGGAPSGAAASEKTRERPAQKKPSFDIRAELFDWSESLVVALLFITILFSFFVRTIGVDGTSMVPTLHHGDYLIVSDLFYDPAPGDIVVLTKKSFMKDSIVKRIIAVEGQEVYIDFNAGTLYIDGVLQEEDYVNTPTTRFEGMTFPQTVPEGCVFVMGDNRNGSSDSRDPTLGMVDKSLIVGHVLLRIWPLNNLGTVD